MAVREAVVQAQAVAADSVVESRTVSYVRIQYTRVRIAIITMTIADGTGIFEYLVQSSTMVATMVHGTCAL